MDDIATQEPVIVADPSETVKFALDMLEKELAPMLSNFLLDPDPEGILRMQESVDAFFSEQWVAHVLHDVVVEHIPGNGWLITVGIDYDQTENLNDLHEVDFMLETRIVAMDDTDVVLASTEGDMTVADTPELEPSEAANESGELSGSVDDILFSPVKKEQPTKDHSVTDESYLDMDHAIYDGCICVECG